MGGGYGVFIATRRERKRRKRRWARCWQHDSWRAPAAACVCTRALGDRWWGSHRSRAPWRRPLVMFARDRWRGERPRRPTPLVAITRGRRDTSRHNHASSRGRREIATTRFLSTGDHTALASAASSSCRRRSERTRMSPSPGRARRWRARRRGRRRARRARCRRRLRRDRRRHGGARRARRRRRRRRRDAVRRRQAARAAAASAAAVGTLCAPGPPIRFSVGVVE